MSAKLIFSDIDGTLITSQGVVSSTTIEAIRKQIIAGNLFIPVSARFPKGIMNVVDKITNFCPMIAYNGALVLDDKEIEKNIIYNLWDFSSRNFIILALSRLPS